MKKFFFIGLAVLIILGGCSLVNRDFYRNQDEGVLVLVMDASTISKEITPNPSEIVMEADVYDISLDYTDDNALDIDVTDWGGQTYTFYALTPGDWELSITAYNTDFGKKVVGALGGQEGYEIKPIHIDAGDVIVLDGATDDLSIVPITNVDGTLQVNLSWPAEITPNVASVGALLIPAANVQDYIANPGSYGGPSDSLVFGVTNNTAAYPVTAKGPGYYGLFITINNDGTPVTGVFDSVRIVAGYLSYGYINLQRRTGTLTINWDVDIKNPVEITLTHNDDPPDELILVSGESRIVTAGLVYPVAPYGSASYQYQWFVDGAPQGAPASVPGTLQKTLSYSDFGSPGVHHLSVVIFGLSDDATPVVETLSSETLTFALE
jgi:hypothetical protein